MTEQDSNVGKKVNVLLPGRRKFQRTLHEDYQGLFVKYNNQILRVRPDLNEFGENNTDTYLVM